MPPPELTPLELQILEASAHPEVTRRRGRIVIIWALVLIAAIVGAALLPVSRTFFVVAFAGYVLITLGEKLAYGQAVLAYKSLIQKLRTGAAPPPPGPTNAA